MQVSKCALYCTQQQSKSKISQDAILIQIYELEFMNSKCYHTQEHTEVIVLDHVMLLEQLEDMTAQLYKTFVC